jgi:hypothetical protein
MPCNCEALKIKKSTFSPRFEYIWLESKKRLLDYFAQKPAAIGLRSQSAIRLYAWAKN